MTVIYKSRVRIALLLLLMTFASVIVMMPADAPSPKRPGVTSVENTVPRILAGRTIYRQEILKSIQGKVEQMGIAGFGELSADDLNIQSSMPFPLAGVALQVKRVRFDVLRQAIVFDLWSAQEPQFLPFEVTLRGRRELIARLSQGLGEGSASVQTESPLNKQGNVVVHMRPPILARPGTPATLIMLGQNVRITMAVVPLQPGAKGQSILVRDLSSERVMAAQVVDQNLLQVEF